MSFDEELFIKVTTLEARLQASQQKLYEVEKTLSELLVTVKEVRTVLNGLDTKS